MKNLRLENRMNLRNVALIGVFVLAIMAVSCNKSSDNYYPTDLNFEEETMLKSGKAVKKSESTILDIVLADDGEFDILQSLLVSYDLAEVFAGSDQYTVFAPTDEAFENLFDALDESGVTLTDEQIVATLLYHVVEGRRAANSVLPAKEGQMKTIETLLGQTFQVDKSAMIYTASEGMSSIVTDAPGETFNISASNGIIHVINAVIVPDLSEL